MVANVIEEKTRLSYEDVCAVYVDELLSIRDRATRDMFRIGDIANELIDIWKNAGQENKALAVYDAVGNFVGKSARTVRYYASIAKRFGDDFRGGDYEPLSFDHYRVAFQHPGQEQDVLDYAVSRVDTIGRPATVDDVEERFSNLRTVYEPVEGEEEVGAPSSFVKQLPPPEEGTEMIRFAIGFLQNAMEYVSIDKREQLDSIISSLMRIVDKT